MRLSAADCFFRLSGFWRLCPKSPVSAPGLHCGPQSPEPLCPPTSKLWLRYCSSASEDCKGAAWCGHDDWCWRSVELQHSVPTEVCREADSADQRVWHFGNQTATELTTPRVCTFWVLSLLLLLDCWCPPDRLHRLPDCLSDFQAHQLFLVFLFTNFHGGLDFFFTFSPFALLSSSPLLFLNKNMFKVTLKQHVVARALYKGTVHYNSKCTFPWNSSRFITRRRGGRCSRPSWTLSRRPSAAPVFV